MRQDATQWSDEQLVDEIRRYPGDKDLWPLLFQCYQKMLYSKAYRTCNGNREDTADLLQEIQLELVKAIPQYEGRRGATASTFIWRVAHNVCCQRLSRKQRESMITADAVGDEEPDVIEKIASSQPDPETEMLIKEAARKIEAHLDPQAWKIIKWVHLKKWSHAKIVQKLGLPSEGASRKRLCDAVSALKAICKRYDITAEELRGAIRWRLLS